LYYKLKFSDNTLALYLKHTRTYV